MIINLKASFFFNSHKKLDLQYCTSIFFFLNAKKTLIIFFFLTLDLVIISVVELV